jgi:hypothetical protein
MAPSQSVRDDNLLRRARAEYLEMPGLRLTKAQAQRLWGLDPGTCEHVLQALTQTRFLAQTRDGAFVLSASRP